MSKAQVSEKERSSAFRVYLYATAASTGAAILIIEILGAKMLAPFLGSSLFVWNAQISVTLMALAIGYYLGGRIADRYPHPRGLYLAIVLGAVYSMIAGATVKPVAYTFLNLNLAMASLLTSAFLFLPSLTLLAMVGPYAVRILTRSLAGVGGSVGRLSAVSTFGSVAGALSVGYVLIPFFANSTIMVTTALALIGIAVVYWVAWGRSEFTGLDKGAVAVGIVVAILFIQFKPERPPDGTTELYRGNSHFGMLQVIEIEGGKRYFLNDFLIQNTYGPEEKESLSLFTYMLHDLAHAYTTHLDSALCIGMGVGIVPMKLARSGVDVDVVEINPGVVPLAVEYFNFDPSKARVLIGDGRRYLNVLEKTYDAVILDAFLGDSSPSHLMSREAFAAMRARLNPSGVLVINSFGASDGPPTLMTRSLVKTLKSVFPSVAVHTSGNGNVFVVASAQEELQLEYPSDFSHLPFLLQSQARRAFNNRFLPDEEGAILLTDDYNPIEFYDAAHRENLRRQLAFSMRDL